MYEETHARKDKQNTICLTTQLSIKNFGNVVVLKNLLPAAPMYNEMCKLLGICLP